MKKNCRICYKKIDKKPIFSINSLPQSAQNFQDDRLNAKKLKVNFNLFQCESCGTIQTISKPVSYYKSVIRATNLSKEMVSFRKQQLKNFLNRFSLKDKSIIEIGSGNGDFLEILKEIGFKAYGTEFSRSSYRICKEKGLNVFNIYLGDNFNFKKNKVFDSFCSFNFMEHWPDPNKVLSKLKKMTSDNSVGIIEVPNSDMIFKERLFSEFISDHIFYFTKDTLSLVLNLNGFEIIELNTLWNDYILSAIVRKRKKIDFSSLNFQKKKIISEINSFLAGYKENRVVVWGAGHQALAILGLIKSNKKIKYIVDSASFKQGKYTPGSAYFIKSPEYFFSDTVDAVILMVAGYSGEVLNVIRKRNKKKLNIAVLQPDKLEEVK